jgi:adenine-specific DNA-methyltransferase
MTSKGLLFDLPTEPVSLKDSIPHIIKYMGSKKPILDFIVPAIREINEQNQLICDLFAGSCSISAALRKEFNFISNDVQDYSRILAETYFSNLGTYTFKTIANEIDIVAAKHVKWFEKKYKHLLFDYSKVLTLKEYQLIEQKQRQLLDKDNFDIDFHLFTKYYSGTYWSFEQCVWIDSLRKAADVWSNTPIYYAIMASIMYGMSYTTQSTGHFAQYRDGNSKEAMQNIIYYREKNIYELFKKKLQELLSTLDNSIKELKTTTLDFEACLSQIPDRSTIYADPPYAPVHYSRFYHALETLVKYDYPEVDYKGRYRSDRHQSPFSQKTAAPSAFNCLFEGIVRKNSQMVLSYSNNGVVDINQIQQMVYDTFPKKNYDISVRKLDHRHSTMGRFEDHERDVIEFLIIAKLS